MALDGEEPRRPVIEVPAQDHPDHVPAVCLGGAAEQGVDGWAEAILLGTLYQVHLSLCDQQVMTSRRHVDLPRLERCPIGRLVGRQRPAAAQKTWQSAGVCRRVEHDEDGGGQVGREHPGEYEERFDAAGGRPHDDNGLPWHPTLLNSPCGCWTWWERAGRLARGSLV